jgi:glycosyltransferase involved in cell wall biosynthesis
MLAALQADPRLAGRVHALGHRRPEELVALYAAADLLVLPSVSTPRFHEPWGLVVNEAFCQGLPALTSDAVGAAAGSLVRHGRSGWVVPQRDSAALAKALKRLGSDAPLRRRLGREAKRSVLAVDYHDMADRFDEAFALAQTRRALA